MGPAGPKKLTGQVDLSVQLLTTELSRFIRSHDHKHREGERDTGKPVQEFEM
jgi:hypothetical protein